MAFAGTDYLSAVPMQPTASEIALDPAPEIPQSIVPLQWLLTIRLALVSFMATSWFLSRTYAITMYLILGLAAAAVAIQRSGGKSPYRSHWIFSSVAVEIFLVVLIYFLVRFRH